jgi:hypothetical protein
MTFDHFDAIMYTMARDDTRVGPAGEVLAANIRRVRTAQRLGYAELSRMLTDIGRPIPELGLRRIEIGERRVDFDDLLALCYVLKVCPVDLMVSQDATNEAYPLIPSREFESESVREWISGQTVRLQSYNAPEEIFADPGKIIFEVLQWMPEERARRVARRWGQWGRGEEVTE